MKKKEEERKEKVKEEKKKKGREKGGEEGGKRKQVLGHVKCMSVVLVMLIKRCIKYFTQAFFLHIKLYP